MTSRELEVHHQSTAELQRLEQLGAQPGIWSWQEDSSFHMMVRAPGAKQKNVQVVWDAGAHRLAVAVWAPRTPPTGRLPSGCWIAWYKPMELVGFDGSRTVAHVGSDGIVLRVPRSTA